MAVNFEDWKMDYDSMHASKDLRKRVDRILKRRQRKKAAAYALGSVAAIFLLLVISLNASKTFAYAMAKVPGLETVVRVLTFSRYEEKDQGYELKINTPQIEGLLDPKIQDQLNQQFQENAAALIQGFEEDVSQLKEEFGDDPAHLGLVYDYQVKTDSEDYLAIEVYLTSTTNGLDIRTYYTVDKHSRTLVNLKDLFGEGKDFVTPISQYIKEEMLRQNQEEDALFNVDSEVPEWDFQQIKEEQNFYMNDQGELVICFDKYEVAAGAQGSPEFVIPKEVMEEIQK